MAMLIRAFTFPWPEKQDHDCNRYERDEQQQIRRIFH